MGENICKTYIKYLYMESTKNAYLLIVKKIANWKIVKQILNKHLIKEDIQMCISTWKNSHSH